MSYFGLAEGTSFNSLFGGSTGSSAAGGGSILSEYASIRNGSYYKLMKSYYGGNSKIDPLVSPYKSSTSTAKDSAKKLTSVQNSADDLKEAADGLITQGSKSVFKKTDVKNDDGTTAYGYDTDAIYKKVNEFVTSYNKMMDSADEVDSSSIKRAMENLSGTTSANEKLLNSVGISIKSDGSLSMDADTFKKSDMNKVKSIFNGNGSFAYQVSARTSMIDYNAQKEASKANTYNKYGNYSYNNNFSYSDYF